ncbi:hypothetical protein RHOSPDRAFT_31339 [Rhodotorula sp. JG-1b]|nr:hypothetical protein RHOSPDRAFT_31339 [Rhodotorula sp. JG-1b]
MTAEMAADVAATAASLAKTAAQGISASAYSAKRRQLVSLVDQLRSSGASTEIDLPRIAVIGNQWAEKSTLVEAIIGIKVPRDAGTCTRCPMEIRLRSSPDPWSCRVSLRFETDAENRPIETIREIPFGPSSEDPDEVEGLLRRTQLAILNPYIKDKEFFVKLSDEEAGYGAQGTDNLVGHSAPRHAIGAGADDSVESTSPTAAAGAEKAETEAGSKTKAQTLSLKKDKRKFASGKATIMKKFENPAGETKMVGFVAMAQ